MARRKTPQQVPHTNGFYDSRSKSLSVQRCINWYPVDHNIPSLSPSSLFATPGISTVLSGLNGVGRGMCLFQGVLYVVCGQKLYKIVRTLDFSGNEVFTPVDCGTILGSKDVIMAATATELAIVNPDPSFTSSGNAYRWTGSALWDITTSANFLAPAISVVEIDTYFVFAQYGTNIIFHSDINNLNNFTATNFWQVIQYNQNKGLMVWQNNLFALGDTAIVPFYDAEEEEFSFRLTPNAVLDYGLSGEQAVIDFGGGFAFIGAGQNSTNALLMCTGGQPQRVSTEPIEYILGQQPKEDIEAIKLLKHSQDGTDFLIIRLREYCFIYDTSSGRWHERRSMIPYHGDFIDSTWRVKSILKAYNHVFVVDSDSGYLGELDDSIGTEYGIDTKRLMVTQPFINSGNRIRVIEMECYVDSGDAGDDVFQIRWTDDDHNWSDPVTSDIGDTGEYDRRVIFDLMGACSRQRSIEFSYYGDKSLSFNALYASWS